MSTEYMKENGFYEQLEKTAVVPVVVLEKVEDAVPMANALVKGGLPAAEVTFRTAAAADCIREMAEKCPDILVGAGTVVNLEQCKRAVEAGAKFIVSPGYDDAIIDYWSDDIQDPSEFMQWIFDFDGASGFDTNFRQPDDMVALNDACNAETDDDKRIEMYHQMQQTFREQAVWIPLFTMPWPNATRADIVGFHQTPLGNFRFNELARA